jgi:hypothetical protein
VLVHRRGVSFAVLAVLLVGACSSGGSRTAPPSTAAADGVVHVQTSEGVKLVATDGRTVLDAANAVASPRWDRVFAVDGTTLRTYDGQTGVVIGEQPVPLGLRPVAASVDGDWVALSDALARVGDGVMVPGRDQTRVMVAPAEPGPSAAARTMVVAGNVAPEAFSTDDSRLFVIEYLPAASPDRYRVRALDLETGAVGPVLTFDKESDAEEMRGLSRTQVLSPPTPAGQFLYTLYTRIQGDDDQYGFVHVLQLDGGLVHCIDLPADLGLDQAGGSLALSPDGDRLYVASATGAVAELDARQSLGTSAPFPILRATSVPVPPGAGLSALAVDGPDLWVGLGTDLTAVDRQAWQTRTRLTVDGPVGALAPGAGDQLLAATPAGLVLVDPASGAERSLGALAHPVRHLALTGG